MYLYNRNNIDAIYLCVPFLDTYPTRKASNGKSDREIVSRKDFLQRIRALAISFWHTNIRAFPARLPNLHIFNKGLTNSVISRIKRSPIFDVAIKKERKKQKIMCSLLIILDVVVLSPLHCRLVLRTYRFLRPLQIRVFLN